MCSATRKRRSNTTRRAVIYTLNTTDTLRRAAPARACALWAGAWPAEFDGSVSDDFRWRQQQRKQVGNYPRPQ